jgi:ABC-type Na+ efflux pump permease subunit
VTGLQNDQLTKDKAIETLNNKLGTNITSDDIDYTVKLKTGETQPNKLRIVFSDNGKKAKVIKQKKKLKDSQIWVTDDLTKLRSELAYEARKAVREEKISQTWVHDSNVFIKKTSNARPMKIRTRDDLPK